MVQALFRIVYISLFIGLGFCGTGTTAKRKQWLLMASPYDTKWSRGET